MQINPNILSTRATLMMYIFSFIKSDVVCRICRTCVLSPYLSHLIQVGLCVIYHIYSQIALHLLICNQKNGYFFHNQVWEK